MSLLDDLRNYIRRNGSAPPPSVAHPRVVIVGEFHTAIGSQARRAASVQLVRELLRDSRFRFFGNESFFNAGGARRNTRAYLHHGTLPPPFDPGHITDRYEAGSRIFTREFQPLLDDLRATPRYVLPIGSRSKGTARDGRLALHFVEELRDRGASQVTPGVMLLGAAHAAARRYHRGQTTTRMILERNGFHCVSILLLTNFNADPPPNDRFVELLPRSIAGPPETGRLTDLMSGDRISFSTRHEPGPFRKIRLDSSDSAISIADQFEFVVLARV